MARAHSERGWRSAAQRQTLQPQPPPGSARRGSLQARVDAKLHDLEQIKGTITDNGWNSDVRLATDAVDLRRLLVQLNMQQYSVVFHTHQVSGLKQLKEMSAPQLTALGVKMGHALRILKAAQGGVDAAVPTATSSAGLPPVARSRARNGSSVGARGRAHSARRSRAQSSDRAKHRVAHSHVDCDRPRLGREEQARRWEDQAAQARRWATSPAAMRRPSQLRSSDRKEGPNSRPVSSSRRNRTDALSQGSSVASVSPPQSTPSPPSTSTSGRSGAGTAGDLGQPWTDHEDATLLRAHEIYGNRWSAITKLLPGRTVVGVKQRWAQSGAAAAGDRMRKGTAVVTAGTDAVAETRQERDDRRRAEAEHKQDLQNELLAQALRATAEGECVDLGTDGEDHSSSSSTRYLKARELLGAMRSTHEQNLE